MLLLWSHQIGIECYSDKINNQECSSDHNKSGEIIVRGINILKLIIIKGCCLISRPFDSIEGQDENDRQIYMTMEYINRRMENTMKRQLIPFEYVVYRLMVKQIYANEKSNNSTAATKTLLTNDSFSDLVQISSYMSASYSIFIYFYLISNIFIDGYKQ